jgi:putative ABC transport system permease protein
LIGHLKLAFRNLKRNRRRNFATGAAIALGFAGMVLLGGYLHRMTQYLRVYSIYATRTGHLLIYKKGGLDKFPLKPRVFSLTPDDQKKIENVLAKSENIEWVGRQMEGTGLIGNGCTTIPFLAKGVELKVDHEVLNHPELKKWAPDMNPFLKGRPLWDYPPELGGVAISRGLASILSKPKVHDEIPPTAPLRVIMNCQGPNADEEIAADANVQLAVGTWAGSMSALDGEIVAHFTTGFAETDDSALLTTTDRLQQLYDTSNLTRYAVWLKDASSINSDLAHLKADLADAGVDADVYSWNTDRISPNYVGTVQFIRMMAGFISIVLVTVIGLSVFNSATMTVIERSQEIGMLRSLGFTRLQIRRLFAFEALGLSLISIGAGSLVAAITVLAVNGAKIRFYPPGISGGLLLTLVPDLLQTFLAAIVILGLTVLTTWIAVRLISNRSIRQLVSGVGR